MNTCYLDKTPTTRENIATAITIKTIEITNFIFDSFILLVNFDPKNAPSIAVGPINVSMTKSMLLFIKCPITPIVPMNADEARFVPIAILAGSLRMEIIAGILMLPKTSPTIPPRSPTPNPIPDSFVILIVLLSWIAFAFDLFRSLLALACLLIFVS